jgi:hypothetical protein
VQKDIVLAGRAALLLDSGALRKPVFLLLGKEGTGKVQGRYREGTCASQSSFSSARRRKSMKVVISSGVHQPWEDQSQR